MTVLHVIGEGMGQITASISALAQISRTTGTPRTDLGGTDDKLELPMDAIGQLGDGSGGHSFPLIGLIALYQPVCDGM